jgi:hypothetical protein
MNNDLQNLAVQHMSTWRPAIAAALCTAEIHAPVWRELARYGQHVLLRHVPASPMSASIIRQHHPRGSRQ